MSVSIKSLGLGWQVRLAKVGGAGLGRFGRGQARIKGQGYDGPGGSSLRGLEAYCKVRITSYGETKGPSIVYRYQDLPWQWAG